MSRLRKYKEAFVENTTYNFCKLEHHEKMPPWPTKNSSLTSPVALPNGVYAISMNLSKVKFPCSESPLWVNSVCSFTPNVSLYFLLLHYYLLHAPCFLHTRTFWGSVVACFVFFHENTPCHISVLLKLGKRQNTISEVMNCTLITKYQ